MAGCRFCCSTPPRSTPARGSSPPTSSRPVLRPCRPSGNPDNAFGRFSLYPAAFDVFEMLAPPCAQDKIVGPSCASAHDGVKDLPLVRAGPDLRLSTAALLSARFPIISPAGILRAEGEDAIGDRAVDGGYFENSGLTSAMDVARELRRFGVVPIVLWVQNDPRVDPARPGAARARRERQGARLGPAARREHTLHGRVGARRPRAGVRRGHRPGHGADRDPRRAWRRSRGRRPARPLDAQSGLGALRSAEVGSSYFVFGMFQNPDFSPLAGETPPADCGTLAKTWRAGVDAMNEVSMSWWLSQSVQAEVDAQRCDRRNRATLADLMNRLSQRCPVKRRDPSDPTLSPAAAAPGAPSVAKLSGVEVGSSLFSSLATGCTHLSCSPAPGPKLAGGSRPPCGGGLRRGVARTRKPRHFPRMRDRRDPPPCPAPARGAGTPTALERRTPAKRCVRPVGLSGRGGLRPASARLGRRFERLDGLGGVTVGEEARDQLRVEGEGVEAFGGETDDVGRCRAARRRGYASTNLARGRSAPSSRSRRSRRVPRRSCARDRAQRSRPRARSRPAPGRPNRPPSWSGERPRDAASRQRRRPSTVTGALTTILGSIAASARPCST